MIQFVSHTEHGGLYLYGIYIKIILGINILEELC